MGFGANNLSAPRAEETVVLKDVGDKVLGKVVYVGEWYEHTGKFGTATQCKVVLDVAGTLKNLYIERDKPMAEAIADAIRRVDKNAALDEGCTLGVKVSGFKPTNFNPMRMYSATFEPAPVTAPAASNGNGNGGYVEEEPF